MSKMSDKILGSLLGGAIGNAMGSIVENWTYEKIEKHYGKIEMPLSLDRIETEDDNRIALLYVDSYLINQKNITPEDLAKTWIDKFTNAEEFFWCLRNGLELLKQGVSPRQSGLYNINTGSALMAITPVGIYNMFEPDRAHSDALDLAYVYQPKADAISAAAIAAGISVAFKKNADVIEITDTILKYTLNEDLIYWDDRHITNPYESVEAGIEIADKYGNDWWSARKEIYDKLLQWHPIDPVEVLTLTTCLLRMTGGDYTEGVIAGTNIGRDADTIANLIGAFTGAINGVKVINPDWIEGVQEINMDLYKNFEKISLDMEKLLNNKFSKYKQITTQFDTQL